MIRRTVAVAAALILLAACEIPGANAPTRWKPVSGSGWVESMCDGPNMLYTGNGKLAAVPNDPRCKP